MKMDGRDGVDREDNVDKGDKLYLTLLSHILDDARMLSTC